MKALVGAFNQEKALVGAFSVIVQSVVEPMDRFTALVQAPTIQLLWNYSSSSHRWPAPATELPSQAIFWFLHTATELTTIFANICKHAWAGTSERTPQYPHYHKHICTHTYLQYSFWSGNIRIWTFYVRPMILDSKNCWLSPFKYCLLTAVDTFN